MEINSRVWFLYALPIFFAYFTNASLSKLYRCAELFIGCPEPVDGIVGSLLGNLGMMAGVWIGIVGLKAAGMGDINADKERRISGENDGSQGDGASIPSLSRGKRVLGSKRALTQARLAQRKN